MEYKPTMSYGSISDFSSNHFLSSNTNHVKGRFKNSREAAFKYEEDFVEIYGAYKDLAHVQLPEFYRMLEHFENLDKYMLQCTSEVNKFDDIYFASTIAELGGSHPIFRYWPELIKMLEMGPFGISEDKIVEFMYAIESQLIVINMSSSQKEKNAYFKMILETLDEKIALTRNLSHTRIYIDLLLKLYPNTWIRDFDNNIQDQKPMILYNTLWRYRYKQNATLDPNALNNIVMKSKRELAKYRGYVLTFKYTEKLLADKINSSRSKLIKEVKKYDREIRVIKDWYKDYFVENYNHLARVLGALQGAYRQVSSDLRMKCNSHYYTKNIRSTSQFLNMCTDLLRKYVMGQGETMTRVCTYFLMKDMDHFVEGLRTFATNIFSDLRTDMKTSDCLTELLQSYYTLMSWQRDVRNHLGNAKSTPKGTCYTDANNIHRKTSKFNFNETSWYNVISTLKKLISSSHEFAESMKINRNFYRYESFQFFIQTQTRDIY